MKSVSTVQTALPVTRCENTILGGKRLSLINMAGIKNASNNWKPTLIRA